MRRVGLLFLAIGLCGFLLGTSQRGGFDTPEDAMNAIASARDRSIRDGWETARWMFVGVAVIGAVFTILPGKSEPS